MSDREAEIRAKAYELWVAEGQPDGRSEAHWEEARRLVEAAAADTGTQAMGTDEPDEAATPSEPVVKVKTTRTRVVKTATDAAPKEKTPRARAPRKTADA